MPRDPDAVLTASAPTEAAYRAVLWSVGLWLTLTSIGFWLMAAASAQVRASCMSDRFSFSVVAFVAHRRASSAYCRN
jgi:hypothetical protein